MTHQAYIERKRIAHLARKVMRRLQGKHRSHQSILPQAPSRIPRILWLYWDQGFDNAPELVRACRRTWEARNPGWDIRILDRASAADAVSLPSLPDTILSAHRADVLRTRLLAEHGGVWVDATTWCLRPLDEWLPVVGHAGFFIFTWDGEDKRIIAHSWPRLVGNWFIAVSPGNPLASEWDRLTVQHWQGRAATKDYFWHNDALEFAIRNNRACAAVWQRMPKFSAGPPHFAWLALERGQDLQQARKALGEGVIPLQKLSWRMDIPISELRDLLEASAVGGREP